VASRKKKKDAQKAALVETEAQKKSLSDPWISRRSALLVITGLSLAMFALTLWQAVPQIGWLNGVLYGFLYAGMLWIIFFVMQLFFRFTRR
jgi:hypothetical protein